MDVWPLRALSAHNSHCRLRYPTDQELMYLAEQAHQQGLQLDHDGFLGGWTELYNGFGIDFMQYHWQQRAQWQPNRWSLEMAICDADDTPWGIAKFAADYFLSEKTIVRGMWLLPEARDNGLGTQSADVALGLSAALGAREVHCYIHPQNIRMQSVIQKFGYQRTGQHWTVDGHNNPVQEDVWVIDPRRVQHREPVVIQGLEASKIMFESWD